ncbi:hypothetical protein [Micromonospora craniellae]|uniref:Uncharacterized protein n=1 Tax=Micromonospora craniellae TaxID=2294034 RepID=A0A372G1U0_9ACTN|nr:hypothetical protein [Micromonospora craniellae]QOC89880.1 hypothetical protein ID554_16720 [Micromonospora craniellae]RFS47025.1 hypothetical protein D0Q02_07635 [Micromonospora craniellae]
MGLRIPTEDEIRARAEQLGVLAPDGTVPPAQRARVARAIVDEETAAASAATRADAAREIVLSRSVVRVADGHLVVEVRHIADPPTPTT